MTSTTDAQTRTYTCPTWCKSDRALHERDVAEGNPVHHSARVAEGVGENLADGENRGAWTVDADYLECVVPSQNERGVWLELSNIDGFAPATARLIAEAMLQAADLVDETAVPAMTPAEVDAYVLSQLEDIERQLRRLRAQTDGRAARVRK